MTTKGYRQVLQIARTFVPGGLGGWVIYNKSLPLAPLDADHRGRRAHRRPTATVVKLDEKRSCAD